MIGRRRCSRCSELVRREAIVCRFCGTDMEPVSADEGISGKVIALGLLASVLIAVAGYFVIPSLYTNREDGITDSEIAPPDMLSTGEVVQQENPVGRSISEGEVIEWAAETAGDVENYTLGNYSLSITKVSDDGLYKPRMTVKVLDQELVLDGSETSETMPHQFSLVRLTPNSEPSVIFQSFSGGAHCCNHIQVAQVARGKLVTVDMGAMDGDYIANPRDVDGDGVADFELSDDTFLYAFAPYALSYTPSRFINVVEGKVINVSQRKAHRKKEMLKLPKLKEACRNGEDGHTRNGACAAFVGVAARVGRLNEAWPVMVASYDASVDWDFPKGCRVSTGPNDCPQHQEVTYQGYPDALLNFLKTHGYISRDWLPPEAYGVSEISTETDNYSGNSI